VDARLTFGRPGTRKPENTSKLEVGATIVVWVVIGVSLWGLSFGWPSYRHHQRIDAAAAMTPREASEALAVVPLGPG